MGSGARHRKRRGGHLASLAAQGSQPSFQAFSKFDFVPGEKIVAVEDFSQDAVGDFPAKWNTDASGEIVTIAGQPGRWLKLTKAGFFTPEFINQLPENVTLELDLLVRPGFEAGFPLEVSLVQLANRKDAADWESGSNTFTVTAFPGNGDASQGTSTAWSRQDGVTGSTNNVKTNQLAVTGKGVHVAVWRQRQRVRVYMKVQIVGHTDSDGDEAANLDLSKRRAAAVKAVLVSEFKIDAGRLDVDGKGESQPIDKNDTPAGKANNRRVEFLKK